MGIWGRFLKQWFHLGNGRVEDADKISGSTSRRRGELELARARHEVTQRGWILPEQDEQLLRTTLVGLQRFGFLPTFTPDLAYVAQHLDGDLARFRNSPHRILLGLRAMEEEPLFSRVLLPAPEGVGNEDSYVDLLWEAAAAIGTSEYLSGVHWGMDFRRTRRGFLSYTFAQRRHTIRIRIDLDRWDGDALRQIATSITPSAYDLVFDDNELFCWTPVKRSDELLELLTFGRTNDA